MKRKDIMLYNAKHTNYIYTQFTQNTQKSVLLLLRLCVFCVTPIESAFPFLSADLLNAYESHRKLAARDYESWEGKYL